MNSATKNSIVTVGLAAVVAVVSSAGMSYILMRSPALEQPKSRILSFRAVALLSPEREYLGDAESPYTLVEFMDYQCLPCRRAQPVLSDILRENQGKLRFTVRNLPLEMHRDALPAAIAAEAAGEQQHFWTAHDALIQSASLDRAHIQSIAIQQHLDMKRYAKSAASVAKKRVLSDLEQAKMLGLQGTPTFLLCCPDGKIIQLGSLSQLSQYTK